MLLLWWWRLLPWSESSDPVRFITDKFTGGLKPLKRPTLQETELDTNELCNIRTTALTPVILDILRRACELNTGVLMLVSEPVNVFALKHTYHKINT